jgi:hypothetical protein
MYICNNWYVLYILLGCQRAESQLICATRTNCYIYIYIYIYTLLSPDDGHLPSPKHVEV